MSRDFERIKYIKEKNQIAGQVVEVKRILNNFLVEKFQGADLKLYKEYLKSYITVSLCCFEMFQQHLR